MLGMIADCSVTVFVDFQSSLENYHCMVESSKAAQQQNFIKLQLTGNITCKNDFAQFMYL